MLNEVVINKNKETNILVVASNNSYFEFLAMGDILYFYKNNTKNINLKILNNECDKTIDGDTKKNIDRNLPKKKFLFKKNRSFIDFKENCSINHIMHNDYIIIKESSNDNLRKTLNQEKKYLAINFDKGFDKINYPKIIIKNYLNLKTNYRPFKYTLFIKKI